jgi:ABC-type transport system involved in multi-copper enzyme maturation permease subunit
VIASLVWKEYREHRSIWIAMAVMAVGTLTIATQWKLPNGWKAGDQDAVATVVAGAFILAGMYGLVCGAMMFAGERESRGMPFLGTLPLGRGELWWTKLFIGAAFVLLYCGVVIGTGVALGLVGEGAIHPAATLLVPLAALEAYVLALCTSTFCRTVLSAVALAALVPMPLLWLCSGMMTAAQNTQQEQLSLVPLHFMFHGVVMLAALGLSLTSFYDRAFESRFVLKPASSSYGAVAPKRQPRRYEVLLWLVLRQGGILVVVMAVLGFLLGLGLPTVGIALWPVATLLVGVACGTAVFAGEQAEGAFKFWGDQRLPVGWLWLRRSVFWAGTGAVVAGLMLLAALLHVVAQDKGLPDDPSAILARLLGLEPKLFRWDETLAFLVVWPAYGFALGQLCCLVWRKTAVAAVVAILTSAGSASVWVPSLVGGGLHLVQVLGAPLLLLAACRLALWDWVTDRLGTRLAAARLTGGVLVACAWVASSLAYRVLEVPGGDEPFDRAALVNNHLTIPDEIHAADNIREAVVEIGQRDRPQPQGLMPNLGAVPALAPAFREQVPVVIDQGWAAATPAFQDWLNRLMTAPVPKLLADGAGVPPGVFIDPRDETDTARRQAADCRKAGQLLAVRALQLQARGADDVALESLLTVLALSRHLRHQAPAYACFEGLETERAALAALEHWLTPAGRHPGLLRRALEGLQEHEKATPPVGEVLSAEYLSFYAGLGNKYHPGGALTSETEAQLMQVPWEAVRARRLTNTVFGGRRRFAESGNVVAPSDDGLLADWEPDAGGPTRAHLEHLVGSSWLAGMLPATAPVQQAAEFGLCRVRAARVQVALALYQSEHKKTAPSLDALVPDMLPELPQDPFSHNPFRYRVSSKGEEIAWPRELAGGGQEFVRAVAPGQGVLWSTGPDGTDDGGTRQWDKSTKSGRDVIFLAPRQQGQR